MISLERIGMLAILELIRKIKIEEEFTSYSSPIKIAVYRKEIEEIEEWILEK